MTCGNLCAMDFSEVLDWACFEAWNVKAQRMGKQLETAVLAQGFWQKIQVIFFHMFLPQKHCAEQPLPQKFALESSRAGGGTCDLQFSFELRNSNTWTMLRFGCFFWCDPKCKGVCCLQKTLEDVPQCYKYWNILKWAMKKTLVSWVISGIILPFVIGLLNHPIIGIPMKQPVQWKVISFFFSWLKWYLCGNEEETHQCRLPCFFWVLMTWHRDVTSHDLHPTKAGVSVV